MSSEQSLQVLPKLFGVNSRRRYFLIYVDSIPGTCSLLNRLCYIEYMTE